MASKFSVIIPVYNVASYLRACLDSVLAQTFADWEAICVDDGSTDDSGRILDEYAAQDSRFRVLHTSNGGVSSARNQALASARGDWCLFLDGDDAFVPWAMEVLQEVMMQFPAVDFIRFEWKRIENHDEPFQSRPERVCGAKIDFSNLKSLAYNFEQLAGGTLASNCCYRRTLIQDIRFRPFRNGEDVLFGTEALLHAQSGLMTHLVLYRYLYRQGSAVSLHSPGRIRGMLRVMRELLAIAVASGKYDYIKFSIWRKVQEGLLPYMFAEFQKIPKTQRVELWREVRVEMLNLLWFCPFGKLARMALWLIFQSYTASRLLLGAERRIKAKLLTYGCVRSMKTYLRGER